MSLTSYRAAPPRDPPDKYRVIRCSSSTELSAVGRLVATLSPHFDHDFRGRWPGVRPARQGTEGRPEWLTAAVSWPTWQACRSLGLDVGRTETPVLRNIG